MEELITATGKVFQTDYVATIPMPPMAFVRILGTPIAQTAAVFGDWEETKILAYNGQTLEGYRFASLSAEGEAYKVILRKEGRNA